MLWPKLLKATREIFFAFKDFKWSNNANKNAGIMCSIVGVRSKARETKYIYKEGI